MPRKAKVTEGGPTDVVPVEPDEKEVIIPRKRYVAYADFTMDRYEFKAGEEFVPAYDFERDLEAEEARHNQKQDVRGLCFIRTIHRAGLKEPEFVRFILPIEEK